MRFEETFGNTQWRKENKCSQCEFASAEAGNLRRHIRIHKGEKSNKCKKCNLVSSDLRRHVKTHSEEKLKKCSQCDFVSSRARQLRVHLKTHTREKPQKCDYAAIMHQLGFLWSNKESPCSPKLINFQNDEKNHEITSDDFYVMWDQRHVWGQCIFCVLTLYLVACVFVTTLFV